MLYTDLAHSLDTFKVVSVTRLENLTTWKQYAVKRTLCQAAAPVDPPVAASALKPHRSIREALQVGAWVVLYYECVELY